MAIVLDDDSDDGNMGNLLETPFHTKPGSHGLRWALRRPLASSAPLTPAQRPSGPRILSVYSPRSDGGASHTGVEKNKKEH